MPSDDAAGPSSSGLPLMAGFVGAGIAAMGFGAGFGASAYRRSNAFKELLEKFPDPPTAQAEQLARSGATRAFLAGTGLAGLMGVGAVMVARSQGITTTQDLAEAIKSYLPTKEGLEDSMAPKLAPLTRTITEHLQGARDASGGKFQKSELGRSLSRRASMSSDIAPKDIEPGEKELLTMIEKYDKGEKK